jgi:hypothetical protein
MEHPQAFPSEPIRMPLPYSRTLRVSRPKNLPHDSDCRCIQCFMKMEEQALEEARLDQEYTLRVHKSPSLSPASATSPVLVLDWTEGIAQMMSPSPVRHESTNSSVNSVLTEDVDEVAPIKRQRSSSAPPALLTTTPEEGEGDSGCCSSSEEEEEEEDSPRSLALAQRVDASELLRILKLSGYRVQSKPDQESLPCTPPEGDSPIEIGSPARHAYDTPYVSMPAALFLESEETPPPFAIVIPQLYSLKRPGSPDIPQPQHTGRTQQEIQRTFRQLQVQLDGVRGHERNLTPASSPRPHPSRLHGSAITDRRAFFGALEKNPLLSARISPMLKSVLQNSIGRSASQDLLHSDRNRGSISARTDRARFAAGSRMIEISAESS